MDVILTHEHTDFDALASLLAASLIYPDALPVLPRRLNRNVSSFLALYHNQFPFINYKELPRGTVQRAILVDTRAVNFVKGMDNTTPQTIIDHHVNEHINEEPLPPHVQLWHEPTGANATLLIERLRENRVILSPLHATLLALGIHEDTGSLTFSATTHRDASALAWVMEPQHNVNLDVVNRFLTHPLNDAQRDLLERLIAESRFVEIFGHTVILACVDAIGFTDELSALASRLRDFHEAVAIFIVVNLGEIIQVVARSVTDEINVGVIADELGGGGHPRAAAAPIRHGGSAQEVCDRIVNLLKRHSRAAVTVQNIMSAGRPQTLTPEMTIEAASHLMRRYGHEGFPVLRHNQDGSEELLGVLTRREADRALTHDLGDQPVSRFMRAGQITVHPQTTITGLRQLMIESNWGQIPVVDADNRIIGIVTRTDLIKLWDEAALPSRHAQATAEKLQQLLNPVQLALLRLIGEQVSVLKYTVYLVGGFVRDLLLNGHQLDMAGLDMDIVIEGNAIAFAQHMQRLYGGRVVPHKRFNTAKWLVDDLDHPVYTHKLMADLDIQGAIQDLPSHLDFVTARTEFYTAPSVLPTVEDASIKLDLHRRDFTINTLALCLNPSRWGELLDFYGGVNDLNQGIVRVLHSLSFVDDPTRILRAVRYEQRFDFVIEARTLELLLDAVELLDRVTPARIRHELERILQEERPEKALARLQELGILDRIHPSLHFDDRLAEAFVTLRALRAQAHNNALMGTAKATEIHTVPIDLLYWAILVSQLPAAAHVELTSRLGLRSETQHLMRGLVRIHRHRDELEMPDLPPSRIAAIFEPTDTVVLALLPVVYADHPQLISYSERYHATWRHIHPELDGYDLGALGVPRGPLYAELLRSLRAAKLDGGLLTRQDEEAYVRTFLQGT